MHLTSQTGLALLLLGAPLAARSVQENAADRAPLLDHQKLSVAIHRLATERPDVVSVLGVGGSRGELKIEALRLMAGERKPGRPGILLVANLEGPQVYTSGLALDHARQLAFKYGEDPRVTALLESCTLYVIPRVNPDGAQARFARPLRERESTGHGVDNDRDGRSGEDDASDVDDDGLVTVMRVPDPAGKWMEDPTDPRVLVEADRSKGERGRFKLVPEGRDSDGDGDVGEDPPKDAQVDRNFPERFEDHAPHAGLFPADEPETRALIEFVLSHRDIALVLCYGSADNLVHKPKSVADDAPRVKRVPQPGILESDAKLYEELGRRFKDVTGIEWEGADVAGGSFAAWSYAHRGLATLCIAPWGLPEADPPEDEGGDEGAAGGGEDAAKDKDAPKPSKEARRLAWIDANAPERFVPWRPFEHPELGQVEIGGFAPYARVEPPAAERARLADVLLELLLGAGEWVPRVRVVDCKATRLAPGLLEVEAAVENAAFLPLITASGARSRAVRPARIEIQIPAGAQLLAGSRKELLTELGGSGGRHELRWLVRGAPAGEISVSVQTDHAGQDQAIPEVQ